MKALSIRQPWAWAILNIPGEKRKDVENRSRNTNYRGLLHIHAPLTIDHDAYDFIERTSGIRPPEPDEIETGGLVGTVTLAWTHNMETGQTYGVDGSDLGENPGAYSDNDWAFGPWLYWMLDPKPMDFVPCKGQLGIFTPDLTSTYKDK